MTAMNPVTINSVEHLIEQFGFPVFVALCALVFFWQMFAWMKATVTNKDCDYLDYINSANKQLADYVANRDVQINLIMDKHNEKRSGKILSRSVACPIPSKRESGASKKITTMPPRKEN